jgi:hypothetical protein
MSQRCRGTTPQAQVNSAPPSRASFNGESRILQHLRQPGSRPGNWGRISPSPSGCQRPWTRCVRGCQRLRLQRP